MKAIILDKTGGIENLHYTSLDEPTLHENEVLVEVKAIGINPVDYKVRMIAGVLHSICGEGYPLVLGWDIAGQVVSLGSEVKNLKIGDRVFGMVNFPGRGNAYAQYVASPEDHLALIPDNLSFEKAAATTLAALTALQVIKGRVKKGDKILIHAGSGGVGHFAIQMAKQLGAYVITTCSGKNRDFVMSLGADEHIDYRTQRYYETLSGIDFVLDSLGGDNILKSLKVVKEGGVIVTIPAPPSNEVIEEGKKAGVDISFLLVKSDGDDMNMLKAYLENGYIVPHVSKTFSFDEMGEAHSQLESGRTVGKVVVTV